MLPAKILLLVTEDWFALSHFKPLISTLVDIAGEVVVATHSSGRVGEIEALGARVRELNYHRSSLNPAAQAAAIATLARLIADERPDALHVIAMQTMVMAALALKLAPKVPRVALHLTGLGYLGISEGRAARLMRPVALAALKSQLKQHNTWLIAENPEDAGFLREHGADPGARLVVLGGAGIDETEFPVLPAPTNARPVVAFIGRMIRPKGVDVLVAAYERLNAQGLALDLSLYGDADKGNRDAYPQALLDDWARRPGITWHGRVSDIGAVWARSDIAVLPAVTREGLPKSVLEAASSGRPLIVTDVPGCRHFVRDGVEGLIVPPGDVLALAAALSTLAADPAMRARMGAAARARVLEGFTVGQVQTAVRALYTTMFGAD